MNQLAAYSSTCIITILWLSDATNSASVRTKNKIFIKSLLSNFLSVNGFSVILTSFQRKFGLLRRLVKNPSRRIRPSLARSLPRPDSNSCIKALVQAFVAASNPSRLSQGWRNLRFGLPKKWCFLDCWFFCGKPMSFCQQQFLKCDVKPSCQAIPGKLGETTGTTLSFGHRSNLAWEITKGEQTLKGKQSKGVCKRFARAWRLETSLIVYESLFIYIYIYIFIYNYIYILYVYLCNV